MNAPLLKYFLNYFLETSFIYRIFAQMPNKKAKQRKYDKKKARESIKRYKRDKKRDGKQRSSY